MLNTLKSKGFILLGARGTGKSTYLKQLFGKFKTQDILWLDFLDDELYQKILLRPSSLLELIPPHFGPGKWVVIDEIQRLPGVLNYVHQLIENRKILFALTGSSARKLKKEGANLLAGRALEYKMHPLIVTEMAKDFSLQETLDFGSLPEVLNLKTEKEKVKYLKSYTSLYLKEEIRAEQVIRSLDPFVRFLEVAAQQNGEIMNFSSIARDIGSNANNVLRYFEILSDTYMGLLLSPYHQSARKVQTAKSKFYFFDLGVQRTLARELGSKLMPGSSAYGRAFEHFFILECWRQNDYAECDDRFYYVRSKDDVEIDLIVDRGRHKKWGIEIKSSSNVDIVKLRSAKKLADDLGLQRFIVASTETRKSVREGIEIWPWEELLVELYPPN